jgi:hypothetical protein
MLLASALVCTTDAKNSAFRLRQSMLAKRLPAARTACVSAMSCGLKVVSGFRRGGVNAQDDALIAELTAPTYTFSSTGKMVVESKADMKKRGLRSPDLADAFLLTFAWTDRRKEKYRKREPRNYSAWAA